VKWPWKRAASVEAFVAQAKARGFDVVLERN